MSRAKQTKDPWAFWQQARAAVDEMDAVMQRCASVVSAEPPARISREDYRAAHKAINRFSESFVLMYAEQGRKAAR